MSVPTTPNYGLKMPDGSEKIKPGDFNYNAGIIDTELYKNKVLTGTTAPTTATIGAVGQLYLNTTTGDYYQCKSIAGSVYTWKLSTMKYSGTATLATANWAGSSAPYSYTLTVTGLLASDTPHIDRVTGTDAAAAALINAAWALIVGYAVKPQTTANTITFYAGSKPSVAIPIMWEVVRA